MSRIKVFLITFILMIFASPPVLAEPGNSPVHWGFKKGRHEKPAEAVLLLDEVLEKYDAYYKGDENQKIIYLTFDNGYENGYTKDVLDVLKGRKCRRPFLSRDIIWRARLKLVKRMVAEGHIIGNHSWNHPDLTTVSDERFKEELERVRAKAEEITGIKEMNTSYRQGEYSATGL